MNALKIDKSFVVNLHARERGETQASSTIPMAHALKMEAVGEGVETSERRDFLPAFASDEIQGYFMSKTVTADLASFSLYIRTVT